VVARNVSLRPADHWRFCCRILHQYLVSHEGKLLSKDF
jgi:hypothetical protein